MIDRGIVESFELPQS